MNSIASGFGADVQDGIADARSFAKEDLIPAHQSKRERVDQRIQRVCVIERNFTADGRYPERVSVMRDARYDTSQQRSVSSAILRIVQRSKSQTVKRSDGSRSHCEDVAQDSADA